MNAARRHDGFTYLALLFTVAAMSALLAVTGMLWSSAQQRLKEHELLFIGNAYRNAIATYYEKAPGTLKGYPQTLEDLLLDKRQLAVVRYLRRSYVDPMTLSAQWGTVSASDGGIKGVYSLSGTVPMKRIGFSGADKEFESAISYSGWQFVYEPVTQKSMQ